jgi:hypothetical protein
MNGGFNLPPARFERVQAETGFTAILHVLVATMPGGLGAALVDGEGETVDYAGDRLDVFDIKVAAAQWRILLQEIEQGKLSAEGGAPQRVTLLCEHRTYVIDSLPEGYALLVIAHQAAPLAHLNSAIDRALIALHAEVGWAAPPEVERWWPIDVGVDDEGRPSTLRLKTREVPLGVIGRITQGLRGGEHGYRVAIGPNESRAEDERRDEVTIVQGVDRRWYADAPPGEIAG